MMYTKNIHAKPNSQGISRMREQIPNGDEAAGGRFVSGRWAWLPGVVRLPEFVVQHRRGLR